MEKKIWAFLLLFVSLQVSLYAQVTPLELADLKKQLAAEKNDEKRVDLLNDISYNYYRSNEDSTKLYAEKAITLAKSIDYPFGLANAYKNISIALAGEANKFEATFDYLSQARQIARSIGDQRLEVICNNNTALLHFRNKDFEPALTYLSDGLALAEMHLPPNDRMNILLSGNLGQCYIGLEEYEKAWKHLRRTLENTEKYEQEDLKSVFMPDYIYSQYKTARITDPFTAYDQALQLHEKRKDIKSKILSLTYKTRILLEKNRIDKAIEVAEEAYKMSEGITYYYRAELGILLAKAYLEKNNLDQAHFYSQDIYNNLHNKPVTGSLLEALKIMYSVEEQKGNYDKAGVLKSEYIQLSGELIQKSHNRIITDLEYRADSKLKERELGFLQSERERQSYFIKFLGVVALILLGMLFGIFCLYYKNKKARDLLESKNQALKIADQRLNEKNKELQRYIDSNIQLENFAYIASHDLKQPLRTILNFIQLFELQKSDNLDEEGRVFLNFIKEASTRLDALINDLLMYSIIGTSGKSEDIDIQTLLLDVQEALSVQIKDKNAQVILEPSLPTVQGYRSELNSLFQNLLNNAIKYAREGIDPIVQISCKEEMNKWVFAVKDNGRGFDPELNNKIFSIFQRLENAQGIEGTGIGLAHCKKIVELHKGEIWADSAPNEGSTFFFTLKK